ncbi:hypothetical protein [Streptomyces caatingaensis]|uniref:Uncharacterized protein n=1 Tax=Streptomyces caatingaensis TaxID=1678637 RepID=A0A0K9X889_9ACTN|nr:hypothetical protein [Streptomyces caatingaensis]KNB49645.1 hypothetical protein AC230_22880 [Streptomyces caatingaensis]
MRDPRMSVRATGRRVATVTVTGDGVRVGDVVAIGGIPHRVRDVRCVLPARTRLEFEDGNAYVVGRSHPIEVARAFPFPGPMPSGPRR